jgi:flavin-dependent dehydrogenase
MAGRIQTGRIVIVGGGPAGATIAIGLARLGLKPVVLEAQPEPQAKIGECLPPGANHLLKWLGLSERMSGDGHLPSYGNRSIWGAATPVEQDFLFGTRGLGWHLDRRKFEAELSGVARNAGVDWRNGTRLASFSLQQQRWLLQVKTPTGDECLEADFLVDATGRPARVARQLGAVQIQHDRLIGAAVLMKPFAGKGIQDTFTLVEAVASGWWYSARLPDTTLMVVYMTDSDLVDHAMLSRADGWSAMLSETDYTRGRIQDGNYSQQTQPKLLPANTAHLSEMIGDGWLAIGDAAVAYDPLSSYGISSAMGSGFYAASAIADFLAGDRDAPVAYASIIQRAFAEYVVRHYHQYNLERRWADQPFWRRRHDDPSSV